MEKRGLVDVETKHGNFQRKRLNNFKSKHEISLVELSASDVEVLDEGSLSGKEIKFDEDYRKEEARNRKRASGGRSWQKTLPRQSSLVRKREAGHKGDLGERNCKENLPRPGALVADGRDCSRRNGAQVDFEKMLKSRIRKGSLDSGELGKMVNKCSVREKPKEGVKVSSCDSFKRKKGELEAEDSGYISKVDGSEEDVKHSEEAVVVVDLCCSSKSISEASASSNTDDSSVEMVGEVQVALETSFLDQQANHWEEEEHMLEESVPRSKRPRLELHANKMQWYLATLNQPECQEVDMDLRREVEEVEAVISQKC